MYGRKGRQEIGLGLHSGGRVHYELYVIDPSVENAPPQLVRKDRDGASRPAAQGVAFDIAAKAGRDEGSQESSIPESKRAPALARLHERALHADALKYAAMVSMSTWTIPIRGMPSGAWEAAAARATGRSRPGVAPVRFER